MADILTMLQQLLCYGNYSCMQEFQQYMYQPVEGLFYAIFFPVVFIIIFIYIIAGTVGQFNRGIRLLVAMAVFAFIILQGWYGFFISLSKMWLIIIVLLGFLWMLLHTFVGRGRGEGTAKGRTGGHDGFKIAGIDVGGAVWNKLTGTTGVQLETLKADIDTLESTPVGMHGIDEMTSRINGKLLELRGDPAKYGLDKGKVDKLMHRYMDLCKKKGVKANLPK
ncbi:MAG: hypothetical protein JW789_03770 [Candidatus Aenigmarchaeota archaeon]|nr:hypothetical protein [Candidatus Aenigmarchaeota archaeon]